MYHIFAPAESTRASMPVDLGPTPVIVDTDIGDDIDDAFCIWLLFVLHQRGEVNVLCVTTSGKGSHEARAGLVMRLQRSVLGETPIPIYKGSRNGDSSANYMSCAAPGSFDSFESKRAEVVTAIRAERQKVLLLCIGPLDNVMHLLGDPSDPVRQRLRLCLMGGSFFKSFDARPPQIAEYNVRKNVDGWRHVVETTDALIVPLDIAGDARFKEWSDRLRKYLPEFAEMYVTWYKSVLARDGSASRILRGTMPSDMRPEVPGMISHVMFDAVALCVALHPEAASIARSAVEVTDDGFTNIFQGGHEVAIALEWAPGQETFFEQWADALTL